jgi:GT2 family glycosyltransferase
VNDRPVPDISVVVPSHDRPLRLRWLLNALAEQTLPSEKWEVVVAHDSSGPETEELLRSHALARDGVLRHVTLPPGTAPPGANRNAAWRSARAEAVLFTDDDCRPPPDWLENALQEARRHPGAIVQGMTLKDPTEGAMLLAPHWRHQVVRPPTPWGEACNILYPRQVLEHTGGFAEDTYTGEDMDLALRARTSGAPYIGAPSVLTYHAIEEISLARLLRGVWRWRDLPALIKRHPEARREFPMWIFWKPSHVWLPFFFLGSYLARRRIGWGLLCIPWLAHSTPRHGMSPRARYRNLAELPSQALLDSVEFATLATGSVKHRTVFL